MNKKALYTWEEPACKTDLLLKVGIKLIQNRPSF